MNALIGVGAPDADVLAAIDTVVAPACTMAASSLRQSALELRRHGRAALAERVDRRVLDWCRSLTPELGDTFGNRAGLGQTLYSLDYLNNALAQGAVYLGWHEDPDLLLLSDYPPFQELVRPKG